jgi:transportin-1
MSAYWPAGADGWSPTAAQVSSVASTLLAATSASPDAQARAYADFSEASSSAPGPYLRTLALLFAGAPAPPAHAALPAGARLVAGALAKRLADTSWERAGDGAQAAVRGALAPPGGALADGGGADGGGAVRRLAANLVAALARDGGLRAWPALPGALAGALAPGAPAAAADGALRALEHCTEDDAAAWDDDGARAVLGAPLAALVPLLVARAAGGGGDAPDARLRALRVLAALLPTGAAPLAASRGAHLAALAAAAADASPPLRAAACASFAVLVETDPDALRPHLAAVLDFATRCVADGGAPDVARAGAEFWNTLCEHETTPAENDPELLALVEPRLPALVAAIVERMVLTADDADGLAAADADVDDAAAADSLADIAPTGSAASARSGAGGSAGVLAGVERGGMLGREDGACGEAGDGDSDGGGDGDDADTGRNPNEGGEYTVRRAAGATLEILALVYQERVIAPVIAAVQQRLSLPDTPAHVLVREAALLALGALAASCATQLSEYAPALLPFLIATTADGRSLVRSSALWTLSKFGDWLVEQQAMCAEERDAAAAAGDGARAAALDFLSPVLAAIVARLPDRSKAVQQAALLALIDVAHAAGEQVGPHARALLASLAAVLPRAQLKARLFVYDALAVLAEAAPEAAADASPGAPLAALLPALVGRLEALPDDAYEITVLLGTLSVVVAALGAAALPALPRVFVRATALLERELILELAAEDAEAAGSGGGDAPRMAACLEALDAVVESAGARIADTLAATPSFAEALRLLLPHRSASVRAGALCCLGTAAVHAPAAIAPLLPRLFAPLAAALQSGAAGADPATHWQACNNAVWAAGKLVKAFGPACAPLVPLCLDPLATLLRVRDKQRVLYENVAITLGLLGAAFAPALAPGLALVLRPWAIAITRVTDAGERADAYGGFLRLLLAAPAVGAAHLVPVVRALLAYAPAAPPGARAAMRAALEAMRAAASPADVAAMQGSLSDDEKRAAAALLAAAA